MDNSGERKSGFFYFINLIVCVAGVIAFMVFAIGLEKGASQASGLLQYWLRSSGLILSIAGFFCLFLIGLFIFKGQRKP